MNTKNLAAALFCLFIFACGNSYDQDIAVRSVALDFSLIEEKNVVPLYDLYKESWNELILISPYTNVLTLGRDVGVDLSSLIHYDMDVRDDIKVLVFVKNKKLTVISEIPLSDMNIEFSGGKIVLDGMDNSIVRKENEHGYRTYEIR